MIVCFRCGEEGNHWFMPIVARVRGWYECEKQTHYRKGQLR